MCKFSFEIHLQENGFNLKHFLVFGLYEKSKNILDIKFLWEMIVGGRKTIPQQAHFEKKKKIQN
jgi:hypothetical protein